MRAEWAAKRMKPFNNDEAMKLQDFKIEAQKAIDDLLDSFDVFAYDYHCDDKKFEKAQAKLEKMGLIK